MSVLQEKVSCIRFRHLMWTLITELQDTYFLARIDRNFIAKEAKYHLKCQSSLKNRYRSHVRKLNQGEENICKDERRMIESRVFERSGQMWLASLSVKLFSIIIMTKNLRIVLLKQDSL